MAIPYLGEIRMFTGNFPPDGWKFCNGEALNVAEYDALFFLIGTTYGGDGQQTFALPDLRGRVPIHMGAAPSGATYELGVPGGTEHVTVTVNQMPSHDHPLAAAAPAVNTSPVSHRVADAGATWLYADGLGSAQASPSAMAPAGGSQPHNNMMPFLCVNFIISVFGQYPSQT